MARRSPPQKDRTSLIIAVAFHVILIGGIALWAYKTGKLEQLRQAVLQYVSSEKKEQKKEPVPQPKTAPARLPPINQGVPPAPGSGTRRAVVSSAPAASGETFFEDTRSQVAAPGAAGPAGVAPAPKPPALVTKATPPAIVPLLKPGAPSSVKGLLEERAKASAAIESFGSEQISRSSVSDAGDIVTRVSGATVVEGKYAVIRGLTDRYSAATLNGAEVPSADPYRRSASLDMFPAKIIDHVTVTKTFTPDQPGSFTGGNINVVTRSFPDRPFASFELGAAYNTQTTGNDKFLTYSGGDLDWLGIDDGTRQLASEFWDFNLVIPTFRSQLQRPIDATNASGQRALRDAEALDRLTKLAGPAEFAPSREAPPPSHSFVVSAGDTIFFLERPLGVFFSLPYSHSYSYYDHGKVARVTYEQDTNTLGLEKVFTEEKSLQEVNWAATASLTCQIFPDHQLGYNFIFNQFAEDSARIRQGFDVDNDLSNLTHNRLQYIERNLISHQLRGDHFFPCLGELEMDWLATFTQTSQDEPDTRFYHVNSGIWNVSGLEPKFPTRYWRELDEESRNLRWDFRLPLALVDPGPVELRFGLFSSQAERSYRERILQFNTPSVYSGNPNQVLAPDNLGALTPPVTNGNTVTYTWNSFIQSPSDRSFYTGESEIPAAYAMLEIPVLDSLRLIGGARLEGTQIETTSFTTVPSEGVVPGTTNSPPALEQTDLLPALGLVWSLSPAIHLRLNYGETVARPSFRELAGVRTYDPVLDEFIVGNTNLQMTGIKNYDLRFEWFPRPGELLSAGLFYKDLKNVIEKEFTSGTGDIVTFVNRPEAMVYGIELEARKNLDFLGHHFRHWTLGGNVSLIESEQKVSELQRQNHTRPDLLEETRPLADQSPYIVNLDLAYDNPGWGTGFSLSYNVFGPRLIIANLTAPDIYEQPVEQLDVVLSQRIARGLRVKFAARNLLDPKIERTYGKDAQAVYSSYTRGRSFSLSLNWEF